MKNFSERLKSARRIKGFSLQDLTDALNHAVSKQALNKYEQGLMKPGTEILIKLCNALEVRPDHFSREITITLEHLEFRKLKGLPAKESARIREKVTDELERYLELEGIIGIRQPFTNPLTKTHIKTETDMETIANHVRASWKLGNGPLPDVTVLLECHNIKVMNIPGDGEFSGLATWKGLDNPVIAVNSTLRADRKRFTLLHELGHIVLNSEGLSIKEKEKRCDRFASSLLVPGSSLKAELGPSRTRITMNELLYLNRRYGAPINLIMHRAMEQGIISESFHKKFSVRWNTLAFGGQEPGDYSGHEHPEQFTKLVHQALAEEVISIGKAAALLNQKVSDLRADMARF